jgi:crotonobetainyl-CoA:carnitine CoA-transferase CaiB-like acyl-CoA transferase
MTGGLLEGVLVVDLSRALAGPHAAMMLGDLGARVIKVEPPGGDESRSWGPPFVSGHGAPESTYFLSCNRNKESIVLDLNSEEGRGVLRSLLQRADVLVENRAPGEVTRIGVPIGDILAGIYGAFGVVAALYDRARTNRGHVVGTSLLAACVGAHAFHGTRFTVAGEVPQATGDHHPAICPYGVFHASDGPVQIAVGNDVLWRAFAREFGIDRPEWSTNARRVERRQEVIAAVEAQFTASSQANLLARLSALGVPAGQIRDLGEVYGWEQTRSQGLVVDVEHATLGDIALPGSPLRFDRAPFSGSREVHAAPPVLDQDGREIRRWIAAEGG